MSRLRSAVSFLSSAKKVRAITGKGVLSQLGDIVGLRLGPGKLGAAEYYDYRLFDESRMNDERRREFVGWRGEEILEDTLIDEYSKIVSIDKLTFYSLARGLGFRIPRIYSIYHPAGRAFADVPTLRDAESIVRFLRNGIEYPFFGKPSYGGYGQGVVSVDSIDRAADRLKLSNGDELEVMQFATGLPNRAGMGYIFQERLAVHPEIRVRSGAGVAGCRLMVLMRASGPQLFRAVWKITSGDNITDNFSHGKSGNMLGSIDPDSGVVTSVVRGMGLDQSELTHHPETGKTLAGFEIPYWQEAVSVCLRAAGAFPGFLVQGWDVVISESGPVLLEMNMIGCADLHQIADHRGIRDQVFREFVQEMGVERNLAGASWPWMRNAKTGRYGRRQAHWPY